MLTRKVQSLISIKGNKLTLIHGAHFTHRKSEYFGKRVYDIGLRTSTKRVAVEDVRRPFHHKMEEVIILCGHIFVLLNTVKGRKRIKLLTQRN